MAPSSTRQRIVFLDWLRGLAALIILQGHTLHSFVRPELQDHGIWRASQFIGGQAAAVFLFVTGITYGLGMGKRQSLPAWERLTGALKRARYLFLIGIAFRFQMYLFGLPGAQLKQLLIVDILNLMGATAAVLAFVALAQGPITRVKLALLAGTSIAVLAPLITDAAAGLPWLPKLVSDYIVPGPTFSIFPWGCYLAFGLAAGNAIPLIERDQWDRVVQWATLIGLALVTGGLYFSGMGYSIYPSAEFWVDSPALAACKMGTLFLMAAGAYLWTQYLSTGWSWVRLLGITSLPVYWVHVELVYGQATWFLHQKLGVGEALAGAAAVTVLMVAMAWAIHKYRVFERARAYLSERWNRWRGINVPSAQPSVARSPDRAPVPVTPAGPDTAR